MLVTGNKWMSCDTHIEGKNFENNFSKKIYIYCIQLNKSDLGHTLTGWKMMEGLSKHLFQSVQEQQHKGKKKEKREKKEKQLQIFLSYMQM